MRRLAQAALLLCLLLFARTAAAQTVWSEGTWYPDSSSGKPTIAEIPWATLTHVDFVGGSPQAGGSLTLASSFTTYAAALVTAAHANSVKANFELGDVGGGTNWNTAITGSCGAGNLSTLITNIMTQVNMYGFDGVMVDYEESFSTQFPIFMSCLRTALGSKLIVWYAGTNYQIGQEGPGGTPVCTGAPWPDGVALTVSGYADRVIMSGYDLNNPPGASSPPLAYHNSPLFSITPQAAATFQFSDDYARQIASACGIALSKVSFSIPFYGDLYYPNSAPYTNASAMNVLPIYYNCLAAAYTLGGSTYDTQAKVPWLAVAAVAMTPAICSPSSLPSGYISYENAQSITDKINYIYAHNMGGWMLWVMGTDYTAGSMPLLDAVAAAEQPTTNLPTTISGAFVLF